MAHIVSITLDFDDLKTARLAEPEFGVGARQQVRLGATHGIFLNSSECLALVHHFNNLAAAITDREGHADLLVDEPLAGAF